MRAFVFNEGQEVLCTVNTTNEETIGWLKRNTRCKIEESEGEKNAFVGVINLQHERQKRSAGVIAA